MPGADAGIPHNHRHERQMPRLWPVADANMFASTVFAMGWTFVNTQGAAVIAKFASHMTECSVECRRPIGQPRHRAEILHAGTRVGGGIAEARLAEYVATTLGLHLNAGAERLDAHFHRCPHAALSTRTDTNPHASVAENRPFGRLFWWSRGDRTLYLPMNVVAHNLRQR